MVHCGILQNVVLSNVLSNGLNCFTERDDVRVKLTFELLEINCDDFCITNILINFNCLIISARICEWWPKVCFVMSW